MDFQFRVAVVDDKLCCRKKVARMLEALTEVDADVDIYGHPFDFLSAIKVTRGVDLVVCDRFGPGFDAVEDDFVHDCRKLGYFGPVVLFTNAPPQEEQGREFEQIVVKDMDEENALLSFLKNFCMQKIA